MNIVICMFMFFAVSISSVWAEKLVPAEDDNVIVITPSDSEEEVTEPAPKGEVTNKFGRLSKEEEDRLAKDITKKQVFRSDVAANISATKKLLGLLEKVESKLDSGPVADDTDQPVLTASAKTYQPAPSRSASEVKNVALILNQEKDTIRLYANEGGKRVFLAKVLPGHVHTRTYDGFPGTSLQFKIGMFGKLSRPADFKGGTLVGICQNGGIVKTNDMSVLPPR